MTPLVFPFDEASQIIQMGPLFTGGLVSEWLGVLVEEGQLELSQLFCQALLRIVHEGFELGGVSEERS